MTKFKGFNEEATEILMGIRFNNNKEWFDQNRTRYKEYVHEPITLFANELCRAMKAFDGEFNTCARVCRANRDIRFSKNKAPYKESKWFFMREDNLPTLKHMRPEYFFEITPDGYHYGLGYWPEPKAMERFRKYIDHNPYSLKKAASLIAEQDVFMLSGDEYKRRFKEYPDGPLGKWYVKKSLTFICNCENDKDLYSTALFDKVFLGFKLIYPIYKTLYEVSEIDL